MNKKTLKKIKEQMTYDKPAVVRTHKKDGTMNTAQMINTHKGSLRKLKRRYLANKEIVYDL